MSQICFSLIDLSMSVILRLSVCMSMAVTPSSDCLKPNAHISMFTGGDNASGFAPSFIEKPKIIPNESGTLITMKCKCKAKPKPQVTWYRGTSVVSESSKITITITDVEEDIYELSLQIKVHSYAPTILPILLNPAFFIFYLLSF